MAAAHSAYKDLIIEAITSLKIRGGASRQAIKKWILENHKSEINADVFDRAVRSALKHGAEKGEFIQVKQSFKLGEGAKKSAAHKKVAKASKAAHKKTTAKAAPEPAAPAAVHHVTKKKPTVKAAKKPAKKTVAAAKAHVAKAKAKAAAPAPKKKTVAKKAAAKKVKKAAPKKGRTKKAAAAPAAGSS